MLVTVVGGQRDAFDPADIEALAAAVRAGTSDDWDGVAVAVTALARAVAVRMVPASDVDDVVQDAVEAVLRGFDHWDPGRGRFLVWCRMLTRSRARDLLRRRAKSVPDSEAGSRETDQAALDELVRVEDAALLRCLLETLVAVGDTTAEQVVVAARDLVSTGQRTTVAAMARKAELDESTARRALARARAHLRSLHEPSNPGR